MSMSRPYKCRHLASTWRGVLWFPVICALGVCFRFCGAGVGRPRNQSRKVIPPSIHADFSGITVKTDIRKSIFTEDRRHSNHCSQKVRLDHLQRMCRKNNPVKYNSRHYLPRHVYWRLLVDDERRAMYCVVPKSGCTTFKTIMARGTGLAPDPENIPMNIHNAKFLSKLGLRYLGVYPSSAIRHKLRNYFKFMVVRHPFDRLLSAYLDKFQNINGGKAYRFSKDVKRFLPTDTNHRVHAGNVSFSQFLANIGQYYQFGFSDKHWTSYTKLCHPCEVKYDFIVKLETSEEDSHQLLSKIYNTTVADDARRLLEVKMNSAAPPDVDFTHKMFSAIPAKVIERLLQEYKADFQLFGYSWDKVFAKGDHCSVKNALSKKKTSTCC